MSKGDAGVKVKKVILAIAIAIIFALFVGFGINVFYEEPQYEDFCTETYKGEINSSEQCEESGGMWNPPANEDPIPRPVIGEFKGYCDVDFYCRQDLNKSQESYNKTVFIVTLVIGLITIIVSVLLKLPSVSSGLMAGGVLVIIYGVLRYWRFSTDLLRFVIFGVVLAILIWLGYKKLNK